MQETNIAVVSMFIAIAAFYVPLAFYLVARLNLRQAERRFYRGMVSIFENSTTPEDTIGQVGILYKRLSERFTDLTKRFRSPVELIEEFIVGIDTLEDKTFKERYDIERPIQIRPRLYQTLTELRERSPFASLSSKEANLLSTLSGAVDSENKDLSKSVIKQLAEELEVTGANLRSQARRNTISVVVSVVSVLLTIFFGIISLVPLLKS